VECLKASCVLDQTNLKPVPRNSRAATLFHVVFGDILSDDALQLVINHKLYLSFEDTTPHIFVNFRHGASNYRKTLDAETPSLK